MGNVIKSHSSGTKTRSELGGSLLAMGVRTPCAQNSVLLVTLVQLILDTPLPIVNALDGGT